MRYNDKNRSKGSKSNIVLCTLIAVIFCLAVISTTATAHPPGSLKIGYNLSSKALIVTIVHNSSSPNSHYINKITIKKNGRTAGSYTFQSQPTSSEFSYTFDLSARVGDIIEVTAYCNISGMKSARLTVKKLVA
jgi:hypothetical protein